MMQLQLNQSIVDSGTNDDSELLGDPAEDEEWLEIMQKIFGETGTLLSKDLDHLFRETSEPPCSPEAKSARRGKKHKPSPPSSQVFFSNLPEFLLSS